MGSFNQWTGSKGAVAMKICLLLLTCLMISSAAAWKNYEDWKGFMKCSTKWAEISKLCERKGHNALNKRNQHKFGACVRDVYHFPKTKTCRRHLCHKIKSAYDTNRC